MNRIIVALTLLKNSRITDRWLRQKYLEEYRQLIRLGLVAGDLSRCYITDIGEKFLEVYYRIKK